MLKKGIITFGIIILLTIIFYVTWLNLPIAINRYSDIKFANKIIDQIDKYKITNSLPESDDWETLKKFGFEDHLDFFVPEYQKLNDETYELIFVEGFNGPYLLWNSKDRKWKIDQPAFPDKWMQKK